MGFYKDFVKLRNQQIGKTRRKDITKYITKKSKNNPSYNKTEIKRVTKCECKNCKEGVYWRYRYINKGKTYEMCNTSLNKLEKRVKAKGLPWKKVGDEQ